MEKIERVLLGKTEYDRLCRKIEELQSLAEKTTTTMSQTPKGSGGQGKDDVYNKLIDLKSKCEFQKKAYELSKIELDDELQCIMNPNIRAAMAYKYIDGLTVEAIADRMRYCPRSVDRMLSAGRRVYEKYYGE